MDSVLFDVYKDIAIVDGKLYASMLEDVVGYDTAIHDRVDSIVNIYPQHIEPWKNNLAITSLVRPHFVLYDIAADSFLFSLDSSKVAALPQDIKVWDDKAYLLMSDSIIIVDLNLHDTIAAVATPHPYLNQDQNQYLIDAGTHFYIDVEYATGGLRFSFLRMNKSTFAVETVFHYEGYSNYTVPVVAGDKIYFGTFDEHYDITGDSLHLDSDPYAPIPLDYDAESGSLFLFNSNSFNLNYFINGSFSDSLLFPNYIQQAMFVPEIIDTVSTNRNVENAELMVYPNPSSGFFHIVLPERRHMQSLQIFDITGKLIGKKCLEISGSKISIDFSQVPGEFYFIEVVSEGETLKARLAKN